MIDQTPIETSFVYEEEGDRCVTSYKVTRKSGSVTLEAAVRPCDKSALSVAAQLASMSFGFSITVTPTKNGESATGHCTFPFGRMKVGDVDAYLACANAGSEKFRQYLHILERMADPKTYGYEAFHDNWNDEVEHSLFQLALTPPNIPASLVRNELEQVAEDFLNTTEDPLTQDLMEERLGELNSRTFDMLLLVAQLAGYAGEDDPTPLAQYLLSQFFCEAATA